VVALALLALPYLWSPWPAGIGGERIPMGGTPGIGAGMAPNVDLSAMTPREAADRLFNRVMAALSAGDVAEVEAFLPMALDAYRMVPALDADGYFHYSLLQQAAGDYDGGLESAQIVLQTQPDHLLALYAAGEAARDLGELELARTYFQRLLEVYPEESVRPLPEYQEHGGFLPTIQETAREFLALGGA
jgi:tetratricopeptide (TPR) repeat protein